MEFTEKVYYTRQSVVGAALQISSIRLYDTSQLLQGVYHGKSSIVLYVAAPLIDG